MTAWLAYPVLALLVTLQTSLMPQLEVGSAIPELVLTWIVCWAVVRGRGESLPWAVFGGLLLDLLSASPMGVHLLVLTVVAFVADFGHKVMQGSTALFAIAATFLGSLAYGAALVLLTPASGHGDFPTVFLGGVLPAAVYNTVLAIPIFFILRALDRRFPVPVKPEW